MDAPARARFRLGAALTSVWCPRPRSTTSVLRGISAMKSERAFVPLVADALYKQIWTPEQIAVPPVMLSAACWKKHLRSPKLPSHQRMLHLATLAITGLRSPVRCHLPELVDGACSLRTMCGTYSYDRVGIHASHRIYCPCQRHAEIGWLKRQRLRGLRRFATVDRDAFRQPFREALCEIIHETLWCALAGTRHCHDNDV